MQAREAAVGGCYSLTPYTAEIVAARRGQPLSGRARTARTAGRSGGRQLKTRARDHRGTAGRSDRAGQTAMKAGAGGWLAADTVTRLMTAVRTGTMTAVRTGTMTAAWRRGDGYTALGWQLSKVFAHALVDTVHRNFRQVRQTAD